MLTESKMFLFVDTLRASSALWLVYIGGGSSSIKSGKSVNH